MRLPSGVVSEGRAGGGRGPEPPSGGSGTGDGEAGHRPTPEEPDEPVTGGAPTTEQQATDAQAAEPDRGQSDAEAPAAASAPPLVRTMGHRSHVDPAAVLLAVERVGADVAALGRALAAQPEEVAARLDIDTASASIGVRLGALGSALDQLRLSLLAAIDRAAEHADSPPWLSALQATLSAHADAPPWLPALQAALGEREGTPPWLPALQAAVAVRDEAPPWLVDVQARLTELETRLDAPRWLRDLNAALAGIAGRLDAPPWLGGLHATMVDLKPLVAEQQRALRDAVTQLAVLELSLATAPGNEPVLNAIAKLPSEDRLRELATTIERVTGDEHSVSEGLGRVEQAVAQLADGVRAGAAIADVLDHLGQRLHSIESAAAQVAADAQTLVEKVVPIPDRLTAIAVQVDRITPLARAGDQAGSLFDQLDRLATRLDHVTTLLEPRTGDAADGPVGDPDDTDDTDDRDQLDERLEAVVDVLAGVTRRQDRVTDAADAVLERLAQQERSVTSQLGWVGERLAEVATHLVPDDTGRDRQGDERLAQIFDGLAALASRQDQLDANLAALIERDQAIDWQADQLTAVARQQDELGAMLAELVAREPQHGGGPLAEQIALLSRRQEELTAALASSFDEGRGPMAAAAVFDRMEQRERSLAARLDRIDAKLRSGSAGAGAGEPHGVGVGDVDHDAALSLAASVEAIAAVTENLAQLVESSSERIDRRLSRVEQALSDAQRAGPSASASPASPPSPSADATALRLAELRAQRAEVQARLQEERLLAAQDGPFWDDDR